jgi:hypothetical protein
MPEPKYGYDVLSEVAPRTARNLRGLRLAANFVKENPATAALIPASFFLPGSTVGLLAGAGLGTGAQVIDKSHPFTDQPSDWEAKTGAENMEDMLNGMAWHGAATAAAPGARLLARGLAPVAGRVFAEEAPAVARGYVGPSAPVDATLARGLVPRTSVLTPMERNQEVIGRLRQIPGNPAPEPVHNVLEEYLMGWRPEVQDVVKFRPSITPKGPGVQFPYGSYRVPVSGSTGSPARMLDPAFLR